MTTTELKNLVVTILKIRFFYILNIIEINWSNSMIIKTNFTKNVDILNAFRNMYVDKLETEYVILQSMSYK